MQVRHGWSQSHGMSHQELPGRGHPAVQASLRSSAKSLPAFDANANAWEEYMNTPLGQLRQELTLRYLARHLCALPPRLTVLDAGGGTGSYALPLAQQGHRVYLLDFSAHMLALARQKAGRLGPATLDRLTFCHAPVDDIPGLLAPDHFDLVLCHTLLEYVSEPWEVLRTLIAVLKPGGLLSLLAVNPYAAPLHWAIAKGDLEKARLALDDQIFSADLFGLPRRAWPSETIREALIGRGIDVVAEYGVRIFADYVADEVLADPESYARLLDLERTASALAPYGQIARYNLILGNKPGR
jgi:S-adenosylmethionine-dependent methyltransferase